MGVWLCVKSKYLPCGTHTGGPRINHFSLPSSSALPWSRVRTIMMMNHWLSHGSLVPDKNGHTATVSCKRGNVAKISPTCGPCGTTRYQATSVQQAYRREDLLLMDLSGFFFWLNNVQLNGPFKH